MISLAPSSLSQQMEMNWTDSFFSSPAFSFKSSSALGHRVQRVVQKSVEDKGGISRMWDQCIHILLLGGWRSQVERTNHSFLALDHSMGVSLFCCRERHGRKAKKDRLHGGCITDRNEQNGCERWKMWQKCRNEISINSGPLAFILAQSILSPLIGWIW